MWIKLQNRFYNTDHIRRVSIDEQVWLEYSNGETAILYGLSNEEVLKLIKILNYDSRTDS